MSRPRVEAFFHAPTFTVSYLVWDASTKRAVIIDSALDFDAKSGRTGTHSAEAILAAVQCEELSIDWLLETHAHADHLSAAPFLKKRTGAPIVIGEHITAVQKVFKNVYNLPHVAADGRPFDRLVRVYYAHPPHGHPLAADVFGPAATLVLVDARHPGLAADVAAVSWIAAVGRPYMVVATKVDKLSRAERTDALHAWSEALHCPVEPISSVTGEGLDALWTTISRTLSNP